jgi:hypothetical protein
MPGEVPGDTTNSKPSKISIYRTDPFSSRGGWAKPLLLWALRRYSGLSLREIGEAVGGMDYTAVSMAIKRFERKSNNQEYLQESIKIVKKKCEK